jgi:hypothetical protein
VVASDIQKIMNGDNVSFRATRTTLLPYSEAVIALVVAAFTTEHPLTLTDIDEEDDDDEEYTDDEGDGRAGKVTTPSFGIVDPSSRRPLFLSQPEVPEAFCTLEVGRPCLLQGVATFGGEVIPLLRRWADLPVGRPMAPFVTTHP